jgi:hypothetical protein
MKRSSESRDGSSARAPSACRWPGPLDSRLLLPEVWLPAVTGSLRLAAKGGVRCGSRGRGHGGVVTAVSLRRVCRVFLLLGGTADAAGEVHRPDGERRDAQGLLVAFDSDNSTFAHGFEMGAVWARLRAAPAEQVVAEVHAVNAEMLLRMAEATGREVQTVDLDETSMVATFGPVRA